MSKKRLLIPFLVLAGLFLFWPQTTWADIVLRAMVVNPSETRTQEATLKAYLPYEANPDDIVDQADLSLDYDIEEGMYYLYKVVELEPGESAERKIRIRDVWVISQSQLEQLSTRARELLESLRTSAHFKTAISLSEDIDQKQEDIIRAQARVASDMPQARIGAYRTNKKKLEAMKSNIREMERLYFEHKIADVSGPAGRLSLERSWAVILGVIISLGVLSLVFFIIWHKQAGALKSLKDEDSLE